MTNQKMIENLWALANGITSFAVLQALAFLYALGKSEFLSRVSNEPSRVIIILAALIFAIV